MKKNLLILLAVLCKCTFVLCQDTVSVQPHYIFSRTDKQHIDLKGEWLLGYRESPVKAIVDLEHDDSWFKTSIPNSVQMSLYKAGKYPNPYVGDNASLYNWVDEKVWYYQKVFTLEKAAPGSNVFLCFDGVDYFSRIWLNGKLISSHEGMFGGPKIDIADLLSDDGQNRLVVEVKAGNYGNKKRWKSRASGKIIKPWVISGGVGAEKYFSLGIWQDVRIEILPALHIERPFVTTKSIHQNAAIVHLSTEIFTAGEDLSQPLHPRAHQQLYDYSQNFPKYTSIAGKCFLNFSFYLKDRLIVSKSLPLNLYVGHNWLEQDITIPNPSLWYPNGLGAPDLYNVRLTLLKDGKTLDAIGLKVGIRIIQTVPTAGTRTEERWSDWQFLVNGKKLFVKGVDWQPADILLDLPESKYRWLLAMAKNAGVQMIRVWGGGLLETDHFYEICDEFGLMVWQDFPIGNQDTPDFPQQVWEAQVIHNIQRIRNHPSLVLYNGGNEFNPYSIGNSATIGILERNVAIYDPTRLFRRTTPDQGSIHGYPDMDPVWYKMVFKYVPYVAETGIHTMPNASTLRKVIDSSEFENLGRLWDTSFGRTHPQFIGHFVEYNPARVPRMLSRASHIVDISNPTIDDLTEASQIGSGEFYQVLSEKLQGNWPTTAGLMTWVFTRPWPTISIQLADGLGNPTAPYYFLKRTYEPAHVAVDIDRLLWAPGEKLVLPLKVFNANDKILKGKVVLEIFDDSFKKVFTSTSGFQASRGISITTVGKSIYQIPREYNDRFLFVVADILDENGGLVSRSFYYPRVLSMMKDTGFYKKYVSEPIPWPTLDKGPWLKQSVQRTKTAITANIISRDSVKSDRYQLKIKIKNVGTSPAFMVEIQTANNQVPLFSDWNYDLLMPGETRLVRASTQSNTGNIPIVISAWNSNTVTIF